MPELLPNPKELGEHKCELAPQDVDDFTCAGKLVHPYPVLGRRVGVRVWCHALRHTAITEAIILGQQAGIGLDQIRAFSRHRTLATILVYRDDRDRMATHRQLADVVAGTLGR